MFYFLFFLCTFGLQNYIILLKWARKIKKNADFSLKKWFTREDFMDYGYILAEELVIRGEYYDAFILLEQIIKMEYSVLRTFYTKNQIKHYFVFCMWVCARNWKVIFHRLSLRWYKVCVKFLLICVNGKTFRGTMMKKSGEII